MTWRGLGWEEMARAVVATGLLIVGALLLIGERVESIAARRRQRRKTSTD